MHFSSMLRLRLGIFGDAMTSFTTALKIKYKEVISIYYLIIKI